MRVAIYARMSTCKRIRNIVLVLLLPCIACVSASTYAAQRREKLLALYPPGTTSRADVQARFSTQPEFSELRPDSGWSNDRIALIVSMVEQSERRTGKSPYRVERYLAPDGWLSLCRCWFYYDESDRLVDADWVYVKD